jgi:hypothetical protein
VRGGLPLRDSEIYSLSKGHITMEEIESHNWVMNGLHIVTSGDFGSQLGWWLK